MELRLLNPSDELTFRAAVEEFKVHNPDWEFAFNFDDDTNFKHYCEITSLQSEGKEVPTGFVPSSYLGAFVNGKCVGRASIRHELNDMLIKIGGHVGYGVIPSERRKGYARQILALSLRYLKERGIKRALVTCDDNNIASARTIEANGGVMENKITHPKTGLTTRRYWITL